MKKLSVFVLFAILSFVSASAAGEDPKHSFINPEVPDFFGTIVVEIEGSPAHFGSGFVRQIGTKQEFVTAKHVVTLDDEVIPYAKLRIFFKNGSVEISSLLESVTTVSSADLAFIALPDNIDSIVLQAAYFSETLPAVGEKIGIYGTGTTSSDFRGIVRNYYIHNPLVEMWQYRIEAEITKKDVSGCKISVDLCKDLFRALFYGDGPETKYLTIKPLTNIPGGFSGGPALNQKNEVVGVIIGGFQRMNTYVLVPFVPISKGGQ